MPRRTAAVQTSILLLSSALLAQMPSSSLGGMTTDWSHLGFRGWSFGQFGGSTEKEEESLMGIAGAADEAEDEEKDESDSGSDSFGEPGGWETDLEEALERAAKARQRAVHKEATVSAAHFATEHSPKNCSEASEHLVLQRLEELHVTAEKLSVEVRAVPTVLESARESKAVLEEALELEGTHYEQDKRRCAAQLLQAKGEKKFYDALSPHLRADLHARCPATPAGTLELQTKLSNTSNVVGRLQALAAERASGESVCDKMAHAVFAARSVGASEHADEVRHKIDNGTARLVQVCLGLSDARREMQAALAAAPAECGGQQAEVRAASPLAVEFHAGIGDLLEAASRCPELKGLCDGKKKEEPEAEEEETVAPSTTAAPTEPTAPTEPAATEAPLLTLPPAAPVTEAPSTEAPSATAEPAATAVPGAAGEAGILAPFANEPPPTCIDVDVEKPFGPTAVSPACGSTVSLETLSELTVVFDKSVTMVRPGHREDSENVTETPQGGGAPWFAVIDESTVHLAPYPLLGTHWRHGVSYELKIAAKTIWDVCGRANEPLSCTLTTAHDPAKPETEVPSEVLISWDGKGIRENQKKALEEIKQQQQQKG